jgi:hypothetical protein
MSNKYLGGYVEHEAWGDATITKSVVCKRCRRALLSFGPDARFPVRQRELPGTNERTIIQEIVYTLQRTGAYAEVKLELEEPDGALSCHVMTLCTACRDILTDGSNDVAEAQALYDADVEQYGLTDKRMNVHADDTRRFLEHMRARKVVRVL